MKNKKKLLSILFILVLAFVLTGCTAVGTNGTNTMLQEEAGNAGKWIIIGQIADVFGYLMRGIYLVLSSMNIYSCTLCIVIFTVITKMLLLPLTIKQQKFSRVQSLMQPELNALQKKYGGKKDQASMAKMQAEQQQIYEKYGVSMSAGCLSSFVQLPILFALYPVIMYFGAYVPELRALAESNPDAFNSFSHLFGLDLLSSPKELYQTTLLVVLIPLIAGGLQFLSVKLSQSLTKSPDGSENPAAQSMKTMTYVMPLFSIFICFSLPTFLGTYWIIQSVVMIIQQLLINNYFKKIDVEDLIKENIEKMNKKRAKKGLPPLDEKKALAGLKAIENSQEKEEKDFAARDEQVKKSTEYYSSKASGGSLTAKANMVKDYNERKGGK